MDIDIVIPWVDGSDPAWIEKFNIFCPKEAVKDLDASIERYIDYGLLKYWFRGIETFAPWVRKIHFITDGQFPDWLDNNNPKLHWVKHSDYIPEKYLPVFSSHPIEMYMFNIPDLCENFIYFNDDIFLTKKVKPEFFFKKGLPIDMAIQNPLTYSRMAQIIFNDLGIINTHFNKHKVIKHNILKWFNIKYGTKMFRNLLLQPWPNFVGFTNPHFAIPYKKSLLVNVYKEISDEIDNTMNSKFRSLTDINQWIYRYWNICQGSFYPMNLDKGRYYWYQGKDSLENLVKKIGNSKYKEIVINDYVPKEEKSEFNIVIEAFQNILPKKSSFEL